jgi:hypothetical protein
MTYIYYAYVPIGGDALSTSCLVRYSKGIFEKYTKGEWIESKDYYGILVGEDDNYAMINESDAMKIIEKGNL